jgi:AhpD family alkylhydroperoxidase
MRQPFLKRSFTAKTLVQATYRMLRPFAWAIWAYVFRGLDRRLAEKILLVISSVNDCRYCRWFHTRMALRSGVDSEQVTQILEHMIPGEVGQDEQAALRFALHYADSAAAPAADEMDRLAEFYAPCQVKGIHALAATIYFGNLCGNTFDAFLWRLRGRPVDNGSVVTEAFVFLLCAPFLLPVMSRVTRVNGE